MADHERLERYHTATLALIDDSQNEDDDETCQNDDHYCDCFHSCSIKMILIDA
jgi:hypothetical protein